MITKPKLIRVTTVPISMNILLKGQLSFMNQFFETLGVTGYDEKHFGEVIDREGIRLHSVEMKRTISPINDLIALYRLFKFFQLEKPQIVHTHTPKAGLLGMLAAKIAGVPVRLHTVAGMPLIEIKGIKRVVLNITEKITYYSAHKIYPNSVGLREIILENKFCKKDKLKVLANGSSNGIDTEYFSPKFIQNSEIFKAEFRSKLSIDETDIVFCFVGRLSIEKGITELINAFLKLLRTNSKNNIKLLLVGPFEKENGSLDKKLIDRINNTPEILAVGRHDDIRPYLFISDIFVFPSYREGFPNVVLQAGAMGLPCIVSDINGCNEIIKNNVNGLIVSSKNEKQLYAAMLQFLVDKSLRIKLGSKARNMITTRYNQILVWTALLDEYKCEIERI